MRAFIERNLQSVLNQYLALDPESAKKIKAIHHKVVTIELLGIPLTFQLIFRDSTVEISKVTEEPDTIIRGTPLSLIRMSMDKNNRNSFFADDVSIEGDLELGQKVIDLFDSLDIDYEEYLAYWIGDIPSYHMGQLSRKIRAFKNNFTSTLKDNFSEYLHEETQIFPPKEEILDFFNDVDHLRVDVDRLEAKIKKLLEKEV
ncbi:MAG TPA: SCP2 sterol-binding domain-containing protein [Gammaproteobacteria bacterium]|jgi:ubiquinone biosynthesis protein UbiJ|nr:SCP2 sterol-binding domain-containing protein [Gammaproteobacteria bacterium]